MVFALLVLATPRIGPPPNVGPLKGELEGDDPGEFDPGEFEFPSVSEGFPEEELPEEALPEELPGSPPTGFCVPALPVCCNPPGCAPKAPRAPCGPPNPPCGPPNGPGPWSTPCPGPGGKFCPGVCPNNGPLFKVMSV